MDNFYSDIGARMKSVRKAMRMTQAQVAERAGIDASFYGQIERGVNVPSLKTFAAVAKALKTDPAELFAPQAHEKERLYDTAVSSLLDGLSQKRKGLLVGLIKDIIGHYRAK